MSTNDVDGDGFAGLSPLLSRSYKFSGWGLLRTNTPPIKKAKKIKTRFGNLCLEEKKKERQKKARHFPHPKQVAEDEERFFFVLRCVGRVKKLY